MKKDVSVLSWLALLAMGAGLMALTHVGVQPPVLASHAEYVHMALADALEAHIDPDVFQRQIEEESAFHPSARGRNGEIGIAQFTPETAKDLGIDPADPVQALQAAAHLMARYLHRYSGDYAKALAAYNAGPGRVDAAVQAGGVGWVRLLPRSTRSYLCIILQEGCV